MRVTTNMHHIRKYILRVLTYSKWARFRDMRPERVDSNLYNYHLKQLIKEGYVEHDAAKGYRLSPMGLRYVDHVSLASFEPRWQPKILTMIITINDQGQILLWQKHKQPFIDKWTLPNGKMHYDDISIEFAANREISYFTKQDNCQIQPVGVVAFRAFINKQLASHTIAHIFEAKIDPNLITSKKVKWVSLKNLSQMDLAPATAEIINQYQNSKTLFLKSYDINW